MTPRANAFEMSARQQASTRLGAVDNRRINSGWFAHSEAAQQNRRTPATTQTLQQLMHKTNREHDRRPVIRAVTGTDHALAFHTLY